MEDSPRQMRLNSTVRGIIISVLLAAYAYVTKQPGASFTVALLIAAALQIGVLVLRKLVPPAMFAQALDIFELLVDGATVLLFAVAVYGGILRIGYEL